MNDLYLSAEHNGIHPAGTPLPPGEDLAAAGLKTLTIDLHGCTGKADLMARLALALDFPEWFGHNWDALSDCLSDLSWLPADGYLMVLTHGTALRDAEPSSWETLLEILAETADLWRQHGTPFHVFLATPQE